MKAASGLVAALVLATLVALGAIGAAEARTAAPGMQPPESASARGVTQATRPDGVAQRCRNEDEDEDDDDSERRNDERNDRDDDRRSRQGCATLFVAPDGMDGRWTHLAGTYDGSTLRLYVDGTKVSSKAVSGAMPVSDGPLRIGGNSVWGEWFEGLIDDVRVYDRALPEAELRDDMTKRVGRGSPKRGLVAAYSFDDAGGTVADSSGRGNTGAVSGAQWTRAGRFGGALTFDGVNDSVTIPDSSSLDLTGAVTLEAWVRANTLSDWRTVVMKEQASHLVYVLYANTGTPGEVDRPSMHVYVRGDENTRGTAQLPQNPCAERNDPCRTFDRAYHAARPGQIVAVARGTYPLQTIRADAAKTSDEDVVFRAPRRAERRIGGLDVFASHVTFERLTVDGDWATHESTGDVTFRKLTVNGAIFVTGSSNIRVLGGSVGGTKDYMSQLATAVPGTRIENILVDGVSFHDVTRSTEDVHVECLLVGGGDGVTIRNSRFNGCAVFDLSIGEFNESGPPRNFLIENNFFGQSVGGFYSLHFNTNTSALHDVVVRYNSATQAFYHGSQIPVLSGVRFVANVAPLNPFACDPRIAYSHNVWDGATCAATDRNAPSGFVDAATLDLHLRGDSAAVGYGDESSYPADDIDGDPRRARGSVDAGADERR